MNIAQKRLALLWMVAAISLAIFLLAADWILDRWDYLRWPALALLFVAAAFHRKPMPTREERSQRLNDTVRRHPLVRTWLAVYGLLLAVGIYWVLKTHFDLIDLGSAFFFLLIIGLLAPFVVAGQIDKYKELGAQSNHPADSDERKQRARGSL